MKFVTDIKVSDFEHLECEVRELKIVEWAKERGYEAFLVKDGICFKGKQYATISNEHLENTDCVSVVLNGFRHSGWDICDVKSIEFRTARD